jgi:hypothetical protein
MALYSTFGDPGTSQTNSQESPGNGPHLSWDPRVGDDGNTAPYRLLCPARAARPHRAALHWGRSWRGVRRGWDHPNRDLSRPPPPSMSRRAEPCRQRAPRPRGRGESRLIVSLLRDSSSARVAAPCCGSSSKQSPRRLTRRSPSSAGAAAGSARCGRKKEHGYAR